MKLQQMNDQSYFITLPKQIVLAKGWKKGDQIKYRINDKGEISLFKYHHS